jgi:predicted acetyltransferase
MDKAKRKPIIKRTDQEKLDLIEQWEKSGLPIKTFSEQHQFSDSIFHTWLNKYRRCKKLKQQQEFLPLHIASNSSANVDGRNFYAEIIMASGTRIKLY